MALVDHKGVFRDLLVAEVVGSEQIDDFTLLNLVWSLRSDAELKSTESADVIMEDVEAIPVLVLVDQIGVVLQSLDIVHDGLGVRSLQSQRTGEDHRNVGLCESLTEGMASICQLLQSLSRVAEMSEVVRQLRSRANYDNLKSIHSHSLLDSGI